jgi:hypothetical protein
MSLIVLAHVGIKIMCNLRSITPNPGDTGAGAVVLRLLGMGGRLAGVEPAIEYKPVTRIDRLSDSSCLASCRWFIRTICGPLYLTPFISE